MQISYKSADYFQICEDEECRIYYAFPLQMRHSTLTMRHSYLLSL
jgi:hypothetical protein